MKISQKVFNLKNRHEYMVEMAMVNVQRTITPKVGKPVTVHMFCMLSHGALHLCEIL